MPLNSRWGSRRLAFRHYTFAIERRLPYLLLGVLGALALGLIGGAHARGTAGAAPAKLTVKATEFKFALSKPKVAVGTTVFAVRNNGSIIHDFVINGKKTRTLQPGQQQTLKVVFRKPGRYVFYCSVPGHRSAGMKGLLTVGKKLAPVTPVSEVVP